MGHLRMTQPKRGFTISNARRRKGLFCRSGIENCVILEGCGGDDVLLCFVMKSTDVTRERYNRLFKELRAIVDRIWGNFSHFFI